MSIIERSLDKLRKKTDPSSGNKPGRSEVAPVIKTSEPATSVDPIPSPNTTATTIGAGSDSNDWGMDSSINSIEIDVNKLRGLGMVTPDMERSKISEEYRLIKRPLLKNAFGKGATVVPNGNLIMVTSSFPGEGKTFSSINLAMSIALEMDKTVLLVDGDVAKPSVSRVLGIKPKKGLVDYLLGEVNSLNEVLLRTNIPKLAILPSGKRHAHSTELLSSDAMKHLLHELSSRYPDRIVIFDSPPLLATSEASVLTSQMGQLVLVVEAGKTPQEALKEALALVDKNMIIGLILNKSGQLFGSDYYGSYSYYGT